MFTIILSLSATSICGCTEHTKKAHDQSFIPITTLYAAKQRNDYGVELTNEAKYKEAIDEFTRAIEICPAYALSYYNRGNAYCFIDEFDMAIADYTEAINIQPEHAEYYYNRGCTCQKAGRDREALTDLNKCIQLSKDSSLTQKARQAIEELQSNAHFSSSAIPSSSQFNASYFPVYVVVPNYQIIYIAANRGVFKVVPPREFESLSPA